MTPHGLILGGTGTGKSHLAENALARAFRKNGVGVLVHTHSGFLPWKHADRTITDPAAFIDTAGKARKCALFIEMADARVGKFDEEFTRLATYARHLGHRCFFIAQRHTQVNPTIRDQCGMLWLFRVGKKTASLLAEEWVDDALLDAPNLKGHSHFYKVHGEPAARINAP